MIVVTSFYKFVQISNPGEVCLELKHLCLQHNLLGTIHIAEEGFNGNIAGSSESIRHFFTAFGQIKEFQNMSYKEMEAESNPFQRLKVRVRKQIITFSEPVSPREVVGTYVSPLNWNELISDPDVLVIDTRNEYEVEAGHFENAVNPKTVFFSEFSRYVRENLNPEAHKKIAMYCTGGIRCEKASSYLLKQGFEEVYHLEGGILSYMQQVPAEESKFIGRNFVFDDRGSV